MDNRILADQMECKHCKVPMLLCTKKDSQLQNIWRCPQNRKHERTILTNSFFSGVQHPIQDYLTFIDILLSKGSLKASATNSGLSYKSAAVDWANFIRKIFHQWVQSNISDNEVKLSGEVEIDESLFGRKVKHNRGDPSKGNKIWIIGLVERCTKRLILYPVEKRDRATLLPIIKRHVSPGERIFTDGWGAYLFLNEEQFEHFVVNHKNSFKQEYKNPQTGEVVVCCTNMIEGSWPHAKTSFQVRPLYKFR